MAFIKLRRLRKAKAIRDLVSQTKLRASDLIMPYFAIEGKGRKEPIESMPGIYRLSVDYLIEDIKEAQGLGIKAILVFGICRKKDLFGSGAYHKDGVVQKAVKQIRKNIKDIVIITDVCLCGYTSHGHCGIIKGQGSRVKVEKGFIIDTKETLGILSKIALSHAHAGADFVAPSAMMDGQVEAIRGALDKNGFFETGIFAYSAKYASGFYGPFREALDSSPKFGDRKSYQMDYRNSDEALEEIEQDVREGADIVMVKPALAYLDIIYRAKQRFNVPLAAYNVSGEYAMVKTYCEGLGVIPRLRSGQEGQGLSEEKKLVLEILTSIKRAGAGLIITYHAKEVAQWLTS